MTSFLDEKYDFSKYAEHRPSHPTAVFDTILAYHQATYELCVDLGSGHGAAARALARHFSLVLGVDPSDGMLKEARARTDFDNIQYCQSKAEDLSLITPRTVDLVISCQAAHWFDPDQLWKEMVRIVRPGGTVAFWNWGQYVLVGHPHADQALRRFSAQCLTSYWPQPGKAVWDDWMRPIECRDLSNWEDIRRLEYEPTVEAPASGTGGGIRMHIPQTLNRLEGLLRTWSAVHEWRRAHPQALPVNKGGNGDIVDTLMQEMVEVEEEWREYTASGGNWRDIKLDIETRSILLMARRK
ncbi:class I SAM-dependent methyltransferase [Aspergillus alliaceus]|uniref:class I SAM-dependent methyltransferase n=1 Tax=Petromyces alliaceus TaxID=209559 RepID=UPI0012A533BD|nr:S-adenosyl-L-methionine-dependent methyltransferase [Aspergillus alliaceus]KAB8229008.1 S-adenosyl-L-methionine-dependent methyltransferase [Aspergillus alliaceus]